ncbi:hypothetical protein ACFS5M_11540 [Lacinutrix iliipiscaria]|uniref:Nuclear transport factor 2 family protein n=1 Tax=Lacinutrix iliipiscaria TaxID=1230532 RepID=A0ABW5WPE2_9FLAO
MEQAKRVSKKNNDVDFLSKKIVLNHLDSFYNHDIDSVMSDYTNESIIITLKNTYRGLQEIRGFITEFVNIFPKGETILVLDKIAIENEVAYIVWHAKTPELEVSLGSGTFIIKQSKIVHQTFIGQLNANEDIV